MDCDTAFDLIARAIDCGRPAHGYLVCGDVYENCLRLATHVLCHLFPGDEERVRAFTHPDIVYLEPTGRSRVITVDMIREQIVAPMAVTSFAGGWKAAVVMGADRMRAEAANALLKSLEEPTARTLFLLLTDAPDVILPTIISRTQRLDLGVTSDLLKSESYEAVAEVMTGAFPADAFFLKARAARRLAEILCGIKDAAEDEDVARVRKAFYKTVLSFVRGWMVSRRLPWHQAFRNVEIVEEAYRRSERSIGDESVLGCMMDVLQFPSAEKGGAA